jgi:hypothetical protein
MDKYNLLFYSIFSLIIIIFIRNLYNNLYSYDLKCIISNVDGQKYCVRERHNIREAVDLLAKVTNNCKGLIDYLIEKYPNNDDVKRLANKFNPQNIMETLPNSEFTAYSENKGEKVAFCLNKKKNGVKLIDEHTLTFVAIHELAHIMTISEGHKQVFWQYFKFLLENAKKANIYHPVDYKNKPTDYCGMTISDNPYYDL